MDADASQSTGNDLVDAIRDGVTLVGEDGKGKKNELVKYFRRLARHHPQAMAKLLGKVLPLSTPTRKDHVPQFRRWTDEEISKLPPVPQIRAILETSLANNYRPPTQIKGNARLAHAILEGAALVGEDGRGKNGLAGYFKRLARHYPQATGNLLGKLLPWPWPEDDSSTQPRRSLETGKLCRIISALRDDREFDTPEQRPGKALGAQ
jgi:hypothetical protein